MPICWLIYQTPLTPNFLSFLGLIFAVISAVFFSIGGYWFAILGFVFFELFHFSDDFDGVIARSKNLTSKRGAWLDALFGIFGSLIILSGMTIGAFRVDGNPIWLILGLIILMGSTFRQFVEKETRIHFIKEEFKKRMPLKEESMLVNLTPKKIMSILVAFTDNLSHFLLLAAVLLNVIYIYIIFIAIFYVGQAVFSFLFYYYAKQGQ